jgi:hypothetical protein
MAYGALAALRQVFVPRMDVEDHPQSLLKTILGRYSCEPVNRGNPPGLTKQYRLLLPNELI